MYAVIKTGGKQYKVAENDVIQVERLQGEPGEVVAIPDVLMIAGADKPVVGAPLVKGASVAAEVVEQTRGEKITVFKKKRRKKYRRTQGHRQLLTTLKITEILTDGKKPGKAKATAEPKTAETKADAKPKAEAKAAAKTADAGKAKATAAKAGTAKATATKTATAKAAKSAGTGKATTDGKAAKAAKKDTGEAK